MAIEFIDEEKPTKSIEFIDEEPIVQSEKQPIETSFLDEVGAYGRALTTRPMLGGSFAEEVLAVPATIGTTAYRAATGQEIQPVSDYQANLASIQEQMNRDAEIAPYATMGGTIAGDIRTGLGVAKRAPQAITEYAKRRPLSGTIGTIGASGGIYGFGASEKPIPERGSDTAIGAATGLMLGGGLAAAAPITQRALRPLSEKVRQVFGKTKPVIPSTAQPTRDIIEETITAPDVVSSVDEVVPSAYSKVGKALKQDFGENYDELLNAYKKGDVSFSDLHTRKTQSLAEAAALFPTGQDIASAELKKRQSGIYDRLLDATRKNISSVDNYFTSLDDMLLAGRAKAAPIYKEAMDANKSMQSTRLDRILRTPEAMRALKAVSKNTQNKMQLMARPDPELTQIAKELSDIGKMDAVKGGVSKGLTLRTLDALKKEIDKPIRALDNMDLKRGLDPSDANRLDALKETRKALIQEIDNLDKTGLYKKARQTAGDYLTSKTAMEDGLNALNVDSELLKDRFSKLSPIEKDAFKVGLGKAVRDKINNIKINSEGVASGNPYKIIMGSPEVRKKLSAVLSPSEYKNFENSLIKEEKLFNFVSKTLGNSKTAYREELKGLVADGAVQSLEGIPRPTFVEGLKTIGKKLSTGISDKTAGKISEILYETDPAKKLVILDQLNKAKNFTPAEKETVKNMYAALYKNYDSTRMKAGLSGSILGQQIDIDDMTQGMRGNE